MFLTQLKVEKCKNLIADVIERDFSFLGKSDKIMKVLLDMSNHWDLAFYFLGEFNLFWRSLLC